LGISLLLLGGCETIAQNGDAGSAQEAGASPPLSDEAREALRSASAADSDASRDVPLSPAGRKAFLAARYDAKDFIGFGPDRLLPILGAPDFVRRDGPAQVWQYRAKHCVLDLFLYENGENSRVEHVELRRRGHGAEPIDRCFSRMRLKRRTRPAG
jgi:hypothetical protein